MSFSKDRYKAVIIILFKEGGVQKVIIILFLKGGFKICVCKDIPLDLGPSNHIVPMTTIIAHLTLIRT